MVQLHLEPVIAVTRPDRSVTTNRVESLGGDARYVGWVNAPSNCSLLRI